MLTPARMASGDLQIVSPSRHGPHHSEDAMLTSIGNRIQGTLRHACAFALFFGLVTGSPVPAFALITGGEGNSPLTDPGWPKGAADVFNSPTRIAWWEGPPFGGGQYHSECRGNTAHFQKVLESFAAIKADKKRLVVHDGEGASFWMNTNSDPEKKAAAVIDWVFIVWVPESYKRLQAMPARFRQPAAKGEAEPVPQIDVYVGGRIIWADIEVPKGIEVDDQRLEAHGFQVSDGTVAEGKVVDVLSGRPLAASVRLERIEPQPTGGYHYEPVETKRTDEKGRWVFRKIPTGWFRLIVEADGYASRVAGHLRPTGEPHWQAYDTSLARTALVSGRVVDASGQPLADVQVRISDFTVKGSEGGEEEPYPGFDSEAELMTDADGRFRTDRVPRGSATIWIHKKGYCRPGLGPKIETPADNVTLTMVKASLIKVSVDFGGVKAPQGYIVQITPEGGDKVGSWGGSGNINELSQIEFKDVPPGKYHLKGRPNPGSEREESATVTVDLKGGETVEVKLEAKGK